MKRDLTHFVVLTQLNRSSIQSIDHLTIHMFDLYQGKHLALLPVEPQIGKALVLGCMLGCLDPVLTIAAVLSQRNPFVMPMSKKEQADQAKRRFAQVQKKNVLSSHSRENNVN